MYVTAADACLRANGASYNIRGVRASGGTSVGMSPKRGRAFYIHREGIIFTGSLKKMRARARARARAHRRINNVAALNSYPRSAAGAHK